MSARSPSTKKTALDQSWPVRLVRHGLEVVVAAVVLLYAAIICAQVFYRFVLNSSLVWSEELVRYGLLWGVMLGAALASDRGAHIALDPLRESVSPNTYRVLAWLSGLVVLAFCAVCFWYGWDYVYRIRFMSSPASQIPMIYVYSAIPVGAALIGFFVVVHLVSGTYTSGTDMLESDLVKERGA